MPPIYKYGNLPLSIILKILVLSKGKSANLRMYINIKRLWLYFSGISCQMVSLPKRIASSQMAKYMC